MEPFENFRNIGRFVMAKMNGDYPEEVYRNLYNVKSAVLNVKRFLETGSVPSDRYVTLESKNGYDGGDTPFVILYKKGDEVIVLTDYFEISDFMATLEDNNFNAFWRK